MLYNSVLGGSGLQWMLRKRQMQSHTCKETHCVVQATCYEVHLPLTIKGHGMKGHISHGTQRPHEYSEFSPTYPFKIWENGYPSMRVWSEMSVWSKPKVPGRDCWSWSYRRKLWRWTPSQGQDRSERVGGLVSNARKPPSQGLPIQIYPWEERCMGRNFLPTCGYSSAFQ